MWKQVSIRWQLIALMSTALILIQAALFAMDYLSDKNQRKQLSIEEAKTLSHALQHDLVKAVIAPRADTYSDISFRVSGFESVMMLAVLNSEGMQTLNYVREGFTPPDNLAIASTPETAFSDRFLHIKQPLVVDNYQFGEMFFLIDMEKYNTGLRQQLKNRLVVFLAGLLIALIIAWYTSQNYTKPFTRLAEAMHNAKPENLNFPKVHTHHKNEIGILYQGYNQLTEEITDKARHLKYLSEHDTLTGLHNRYFIEQKIAASLAEDGNQPNSLLMIDIDEFKIINDTAGHAAGDDLLKQVSLLLSQAVEDSAVLARIGGDDFMILLPGLDENQAQDYASNLAATLNGFRFTWQEHLFNITCTIGGVCYKPFEFTPQSISIALDSAFYAAKAKGHGQTHFYRPDDEKVQQYRSDVETVSIIRDALLNGEARFELYAQAIVPFQKNTTQVSYEILLRLKDAEGNLVYPDVFLPTADRYQLMVAVDSYVLWQYLETVSQHPEHIRNLAFVNINLGGATLNNPEFQEKIRQAISTFDFPWDKLVLEVTETSAVGNLALAADFIQYCRKLGMRVALDDFGTGMASFEYLKHLPLDVVKIDGSFVRDMLDDPVDRAMVSYVNDISKLRNQETIAEFVEFEEHEKLLKEIGIDYGQGYYLEKPKPLQDWL
jgi:diguanylate cyclase (GGDEF)-like protein